MPRIASIADHYDQQILDLEVPRQEEAPAAPAQDQEAVSEVTQVLDTAIDFCSLPKDQQTAAIDQHSEQAMKKMILNGVHVNIDQLDQYIEQHKASKDPKENRVAKILQNIKKHIGPDGKIHATYILNGQISGRFSCKDPSMFGSPRKHRDVFHGESQEVAAIDFRQMEARIMAHLSGEENLLVPFAEGKDVYQDFAEKLGISRDQAKILLVGIPYGLSPVGIERELGVTKDQAEDIYRGWRDAYPTLYKWVGQQKINVKKYGYVDSAYGKRFDLPLKAPNTTADRIFNSTQYNKGIAIQVQGTAAQVSKLAMIALDRAGFTIRAFLHDEIWIDLDETHTAEKAQQLMNQVDPRFNLATSVRVAKSFGQIKKTNMEKEDESPSEI